MSGALGAARWPTALGVAAPVAGALAAQFWNYLIAALAGLLEHAFSSVSVLGFWACSGNPVGWRVQVRGYLANAYADLERELPAGDLPHAPGDGAHDHSGSYPKGPWQHR